MTDVRVKRNREGFRKNSRNGPLRFRLILILAVDDLNGLHNRVMDSPLLTELFSFCQQPVFLSYLIVLFNIVKNRGALLVLLFEDIITVSNGDSNRFVGWNFVILKNEALNLVEQDSFASFV